jgi:hypothetical protein
MNPSDLENELRQLRPAKPSAALEQAISRELATTSRAATSGVLPRREETFAGRLLNGLCWALGGAAVAVVSVVAFNAANSAPANPIAAANTTPEAPAAPSVFEPVTTTRELVDAEDGGLVYEADEGPSRIVMYRSRERHIWSNPSTGALVEVEVPRRDVMLVPVSFQ